MINSSRIVSTNLRFLFFSTYKILLRKSWWSWRNWLLISCNWRFPSLFLSFLVVSYEVASNREKPLILNIKLIKERKETPWGHLMGFFWGGVLRKDYLVWYQRREIWHLLSLAFPTKTETMKYIQWKTREFYSLAKDPGYKPCPVKWFVYELWIYITVCLLRFFEFSRT